MSIRDLIKAAADVKSEIVPVPEWGVDVGVVTMDGHARDRFGVAVQSSDKTLSFWQATLLVATCVDESGAPVFSAEDVDWLRTKSAAALDRVAKVAERLNGIGAGAVEDAAKNSEAAPSGSSGSV